MALSKPRILLLDIETVPSTVFAWGAKVPSGWISSNMLVEEANIACAAWKWLGEPRVYTAKMNQRLELPDLPIVKALAAVWAKADAIVAQNGDGFDLKWIKARMVKAGLPPPPPVVQIDTLKIIRQNFSNYATFSAKLDDVAKFLGLGSKIKVDFDLWREVKKGNPAALSQMLRYNVHDVKLLEKVYKRIRPYTPAKINRALFDERPVCPSCGENALQARGYAFSRARKAQRFACTSCGAWSQQPIKKPSPRVVR